MNNEFVSKSGQLKSVYIDGLMKVFMLDSRKAGIAEHLDFMAKTGDMMRHFKTGKMLVDMSGIKNFDLMIRSAAVKVLPEAVLNKVPYFVIAGVKGSSLFENMAMQTAFKVAIPLSKKFLDGKMFDAEKEAAEWLKNFPVPNEFQFL